MKQRKLKMMIVGAFPKREIVEHGGVLTSCRILMASTLPERMDLVLIDSCSPSVPPPSFSNRLGRAVIRFFGGFGQYLFYRPDVVLLFSSPGASFIEKSVLGGVARVFGIKVLMFPRGAQLIGDYKASRWHAFFLKRLLSVPNKILCQGMVYRDFFVNDVGIDEKKCPVVPNWTATRVLLEIGEMRILEVPDCINILFVGWVYKEKGVFELLEAIKLLVRRSENKRFKLCMAGEGAALAAVRSYVDSNGLKEYVELPGWINEKQKIGYYKDAHILVLPSYMEGMPNVVIEAMASGLPVVASNVGAVGDMIKSGVNGIIISPGSSQDIFTALDLLLADADLRYRLGKEAWRDADEKYNADRAVELLVEIANEAVNE